MKISFILISYNQINKLEKAIKSISFSNIPSDDYEIIISDDGSTDKTVSVIRESYPNVLLLDFAINTRNQSLMRNSGIRKASGDYLFFLDGDDYFDSIELYNIYLKLEDKDVYFPDALIFDCIYNNSRIINIKIDDIKNPNRRIYHSICNYVVKRKFILNNNIFFHEEKYNYENEDMFFTYLILDKMKTFMEIDNCSYIYTYSVNSNSSKTISQFPSFLEYIFELSDYVKENTENEKLHILVDFFILHQLDRFKKLGGYNAI